MYRGKNPRALPIIVMILIVAVIIAALFSVGRALFGGSSTSQLDQGQSALLDTSGGAHVQMSVRGPLVAQEKFRSYQFDISPTSRNLTTFGGYQADRLDSRQLTNNTTAYEQFVYALNRTGFMSAKELTGDRNDTRGVCAQGRVYEFSVLRGDQTVKSLWTSTCNGARGSFQANLDQVRTLFEQQIPDSATLIQSIAF